ncbi:type II toxin-antitoxin system RelE/ParE family toxin [Vibrio parahaemolyticus]|uniref:type II toxin-antitoxin system RelE/ParE family toxin n=1 Tax=Vibrio parahaemolyticus TaxID=670 RepID=UPI00186AA790|nr:type II toxin-antitoxin system RelE/ParE family toxin [Vibrio parahaemolyticus]MBE3793536.1 type II toxin-antitoxin system RelE/ParE family toxin [Vibrio parahaemolyticus]MBE3866396.1 type II toxin-antitoxin system RelE/ParE family toxin [Vibrio parahaemolyticus]MCZ5880338.1 type II toxin-antitoxin system RelE/ParE family toxin [Vibrio parahaemolyticus]MDF4424225.1 type II toxin-antitoxin system RelE/ParE family toxin [Vibrio parahaemolyticus]MDF4582604.1 type II toxin-antitoxin system RelE
MKIYVTDSFDKFMRKAKVTDDIIVQVSKELDNGLHDGDLNMGKLFKKRIASPKQSKRDSNRSVVAVQKGNRLFFIQGWRKVDIPKKGKEIPDKLLEAYKLMAETFISFTPNDIEQSINDGLLREVKHD